MVKKQAVVEGALEVPKDALHSREMGLTRVMHVEAHLLDRIGNVGLVKVRYWRAPARLR
jgi:hypothetical protein